MICQSCQRFSFRCQADSEGIAEPRHRRMEACGGKHQRVVQNIECLLLMKMRSLLYFPFRLFMWSFHWSLLQGGGNPNNDKDKDNDNNNKDGPCCKLDCWILPFGWTRSYNWTSGKSSTRCDVHMIFVKKFATMYARKYLQIIL